MNNTVSTTQKYQVIDDFLPEEDFLSISKYLLSEEVRWRHLNYTTNLYMKDPVGLHTLTTIFVDTENEGAGQKHVYQDSYVIAPYLNKLVEYLGGGKYLYRCRAFKTLSMREYKESEVLQPHVDYVHPHISTVLYLGDSESEGSTILYNEMQEDIPYDLTTNIESKLSELVRVQPRRNRLLVFEGNRYHSMLPPSMHNSRTIVNAGLSYTSKPY